jgi:hypothetical protein
MPTEAEHGASRVPSTGPRQVKRLIATPRRHRRQILAQGQPHRRSGSLRGDEGC